jgi:hypothetical protein
MVVYEYSSQAGQGGNGPSSVYSTKMKGAGKCYRYLYNSVGIAYTDEMQLAQRLWLFTRDCS